MGVKGQFTVRVYTQLNSAANDESFGIDNVVLKKLPPFKTITANFQNDKDFQGFNCQDPELWLVWQDLWWLQHQGQGARHQEDVQELARRQVHDFAGLHQDRFLGQRERVRASERQDVLDKEIGRPRQASVWQ